MPWTISFHEAALAEANALSADVRAKLNRMVMLIAEHGLEALLGIFGSCASKVRMALLAPSM